MKKMGLVRVLWGVHPSQINESFELTRKDYVYKYYSQFCDDKKIDGMFNDDLRWIQSKDRLSKVKSNIERALSEKIKFDFTCYTFGEENHQWLLSKGVNSVLIHKFPNPYYMYRHKMEAWIYGMKDFDEIVFLDWDTKPLKPIDNTFWDLLSKKDPIQVSLGRYKHHRLKHRDSKDNGWMPSAQFVYFRDKSLVDRAVELWKYEDHRWAEEPGLARLTDELMGGWNMEQYKNRFEPQVFTVSRCPYSSDGKNPYFANRGHPWKY